MIIDTSNETNEQRLIGLLLINNDNYIDKIETAYTKLRPEYFNDKQLGIIFDALKSLRTATGEPTDIIALKTMLLTFPDFKGEYEGAEGKLTQDIAKLMKSGDFVGDSYDGLTAAIVQEYVTREIEKINSSNKTAEDKLKSISLIQEKYEKSMNDEADHVCMAAYMANDFITELKERKEMRHISTGFKDIDEELSGGIGLCPTRLHVIGAVSSAGKTTLVHQIADNIAEAGTPVLYFSLEQSRFEMVCKSLVRLQHKKRLKDKKTLELTEAIIPQLTEQSADMKAVYDEYNSTIAPNMYIYESNFSMNIDRLVAIVKRFTRTNSVKPVVIVDYLQILKPSESLKSTLLREKIDDVVNKLKILAVSEKIAVLAISSFGRAAYTKEANFESFKESGGIEYSSDVALALQFQNMTDSGFNMNKAKQGEKINNIEGVRKMEIVSLKNRGGEAIFKKPLLYYPKYNYFEVES